jgi:hypothetical protein
MNNLDMLPEEILRRIREESARAKAAQPYKNWRPPKPEDFHEDRRVLCFDQTLNHCGWAVLSTKNQIYVPRSGTLRPPVIDAKGFEGTFTKAVVLAGRLRDLLEGEKEYFDEVAIELPSIMGYRTESSLVAAVTICIELDRLGRPFPAFVSRNSAASTLCGDRLAPKKASSDVVEGMVEWHEGGTGRWTEHVRDAVFVGLKAIHRG